MSFNGNFLMLVSCGLFAAAAAMAATCLGPVWDRVAASQTAALLPRLHELRIDSTHLCRYLRWWGAAMVGVFAAFGLLGMWPLAFAAVYLVYISPTLILSRLIRKRSYLLRDQMVTACAALANTARAGLSLPQGLQAIVTETKEPLSRELLKIVADYRRGRPLSEAITEAKDRLNLDSFTLFASCIVVAQERGGRITDSLDRISRSLQENQRLERKIEADTEAGRKVVVILAAFPFLFLGLFALLDPEGTGLIFSTFPGQVVFVLVIALVYACVRWCGRILAIEV